MTSNTEKYEFFTYSWFIDDKEEEITSIRIYGLNKKNENICVRIDDFTPYVYLELPDGIKWDSGKAQLIGNKLDELLGNQKPLKKVLMMKKRLYGAHIDSNGKRKLFPYLFCSFSSPKDIKVLGYKIRKTVNIVGIGGLSLKIHESDADPILQFTCCRKLVLSGWAQFIGKRVTHEHDKLTICDHEFKVKWKNISPSDCELIPKPKIMGYDIEVNSTNVNAMPQPHKPGDKIFQISCILSRYGDTPENYKKYLLTLGDPDPIVTGVDVIIQAFPTEASLLEGFTKLIRTENPNLIAGYNIMCFDIPYMIARAKLNMCMFNFDLQGFHKYSHSKEKTIKWSSSAYKNQEFQFLDAEGRVFVDLLTLVRRDYKFNNYKLKTVSTFFLGKTKDDLDHKGIFKCYRLGIKKNTEGVYGKVARKAMAICGKYCVQDSVLVVLLADKLQTWVGLTEMSKTCNVPIFTLYTQGQQIKVYSQLYKHCTYNNIVVEKDKYEVKENERYVGAHVFDPIQGKHRMVVPFDFASLYPTTIIAYNIDYHTWVSDDSKIPNSECHIMEWEDHISCAHDPKVIRKMELNKYIDTEKEKIKKLREKRDNTLDKLRKQEIKEEIKNKVDDLKPYSKERSEITKTISKNPMCEKRYYRFLKKPMGVIPTIIQGLLDARKHTRKVDMVKCKKKIKELEDQDGSISDIIELKNMLNVLDKRQLAYKVSSNSMYGAMGVKKGYLPFMPGAMCTTYMGRVNIEKVAKTLTSKYDGKLIYGDTDSNYVTFPNIKTAQEIWDYALYVADEISKIFPRPIVLEFEEEIYAFFFILTKKRYMYRKCLRDGVEDKKIGKKGVLLARRDNSKFVRDIYEGVISQIADGIHEDDILYWILTEINDMFSGMKPYSEFIITKAVGNSGNLEPEPFINEKGEKKTKVGNYTVPRLSSDPKERANQLTKKNAENATEFYLFCLPAQVQLAERMKMRGQRVDTGSRLEYIVSNPDNHTAKQYEKVESADYYAKHSNIVKIDYYYYLKALATPLDQVLSIAYPKFGNMILSQYNFRWKVRYKVLQELKKVFKPNLKFV